MIKAAVTWIVNHKGQVLLLKRGPSDVWQPEKWGLPGGHLNQNETFEQAVIREVKEEANLTIVSPQLVHVIKNEMIEVHYFVTKNFFGKIKVDFEHSDFRWFYPKDIKDSETTPNLHSLTSKFVSI